jgi:single-stranded-DNA-specific exonuclease
MAMVLPAMPAPRWTVGARDFDAEAVLQRELGVPALVAALLAQRGYATPELAEDFLNPRLDDLLPPHTLPDYEAARNAILSAKENGDLIFVHGDYDVDGVTSAAIFNRFLTKIGCRVHTHVPHRMREGYGIHRSAVQAAIAMGAKLFLTCDCGVGAHEQVAMARAAGMKVVVTDHHSIGATLPEAHAVVNPHRSDSQYAFPEISGAGVAFKLCLGLCDELGFQRHHFYNNFLDLVTLGTIADVMPLVGENRIIARHGLARLGETKKVGLRALMREAKIEDGTPIRGYHVGFVLGPRLNAAGRLSDAAKALQLLLETDEIQAGMLAREIDAINTERKTQQQRIVDEAVERVVERAEHQRNIIVVGGPDWHSGIVGIVAGRLVETFNRPTFVVHIDEATGICKGSARTIPNFHLADAIRAHPELFLSGGGHAAAAGCSFRLEDFDRVVDALDLYAGSRLKPEDLIPAVAIDLEVRPRETTMAVVEAMERLEPFGCANPEPTFLARGATFCQVDPTKNPDHARVRIRHGDGPAIAGVAFHIGERVLAAGSGATADVLFQPKVNEWQGYRSLQWEVRDFRVQVAEA